MTAYEFAIYLHNIKDLILWLVPVLVAAVVCVTAFFVVRRWLQYSHGNPPELEQLRKRINRLEERIDLLEKK